MNENPSANRQPAQLVLEGIVTSQNEDGTTNISPMGPVVDREMVSLRLRPFRTSTTYQNLKRTRHGIFHITDDVELLVRAAIGQWTEPPSMHACAQHGGQIIDTACRWYAFTVQSLDDSDERVEIECRTVGAGHQREFLGWNRAMHAVLEAAILATRIHLIPREEICSEFDKLSVIVEKTASHRERNAFALLRRYLGSSPGA